MNKIVAATLVAIIALSGAAFGADKPESIEGVQKDLAAVGAEIDALSTELDRIEELVKAPQATILRIEVRRSGETIAPSSIRLVVKKKVEDERDFGKAERDAFAGPSAIPLVVQLPYFPGQHSMRIELTHPTWKSPAAIDLDVPMPKGQTMPVRLDLSLPKGQAVPGLALSKVE